MLRAARFAAQLRFAVDPAVVAAMTAMAADLDRITAERIRDEFTKLLCGADPVTGLRLLVDTGLADRFLPELPGLKLEIDEHAQHKDVYEHTLIVRAATRSGWRATRGRTSCCGWPRSCTTSASRPPRRSAPTGGSASTTTRWSAPG